jgi:hypothetical protein
MITAEANPDRECPQLRHAAVFRAVRRIFFIST